MRKLILLLLVFALCFTACGAKETTAPHTYDDLTIRIPTEYVELTGEDFAAGLDFIFGLDPIAINGLREEKATFEAYGLSLDLESYGSFVILANNVSATLEQKDGIHTFSYESGGFTYVTTIWETEDAFWTVQAYCPTENYAKAKKDMWNILSSVTV
jgi:hypothetical protein